MRFSFYVFPFLLTIGLSSLWASPYLHVTTKLNLGFSGGPSASVFASDTVDRYGSNWRGLEIPLENGRYYERIDPFFALIFDAGLDSFRVHIEAPLRKDLEAWYDSPLHSNWTLSPSDLDINVPTDAYAKWNNKAGFVQVGRFKPDLGPSPNTLAVGGAPYHDAILWRFFASRFRYDFLLSSLNPWLHGTPESTGVMPGDSTEAYKQIYGSVDNQRNRSYSEPYKTLIYHSFGLDFERFWVKFIEQSLVGGKQIEFRSMNPFMFLHDNYGSGYTKASSLFEWGFRPVPQSSFYWQVNLEDVASPVGETEGATTRAIISYFTGFRYEWKTLSQGDFIFRFDVVYTDPAYNNQELPLLKYTSRRMYRSNYRSQTDPDFADMYFVDYPLGYRRGPDALDMWLDVSWKKGIHKANLELGYLRQGDKNLYTDYETAIQTSNGLSGVVESQYIADLIYYRECGRFVKLYLGGGARFVQNFEHQKVEKEKDFWLRSGIVISNTFFD